LSQFFKQKISQEIFKEKYCLNNEQSVEEVFQKVTEELSENDSEKELFYNQLVSGKLMPAGRILANARPDSKMKNYNNCFTIDIEDSMEGIFDALKEDALISKTGGGVGFNVSKIRPKNTLVATGGISSGVISFLKVFDQSAEVIHTGGQRRCLPSGSKVFCKTGIKNIEDVKIGDMVKTSTTYQPVTHTFDQGLQDTIIIHTQAGDFECTAEHKMAVMDSFSTYVWKKASDLTHEDRLVFIKEAIEGEVKELPRYTNQVSSIHSTTCKDITIPILDTQVAWFFGYIYGNGHIKYTQTKGHVGISIPTERPEVIREIQDCFLRFGITPKVKSTKGNWVNVIGYSRQLAEYFIQFKQPNEDMPIPSFIQNNTIEIRSAFLAGLFDAEGHHGRPWNLVTSVYPKLVQDVSLILNGLGIPHNVKVIEGRQENWKALLKVNIPFALGVKQVEQLIAPYSLKFDDNVRTSAFYRSSNSDLSFNKSFYEASLLRDRDIRGKWSQSNKTFPASTYEMCVNEDLTLLPIQILGFDIGNSLQTYDIEVHEQHEFVCNGFLTHNSAHIAILNVDHPDIEEFVTCKQGDGNNTLTQFNISVGITDKFIDAVKKDEDWDLKFKGKVYKTVKAKHLYDLMTKNAYQHNEPGVLMLDTVEKYNNGYWAFKMDRCNP